SARCAAPAGIRTARAKVLSAVNRERRARGLAAVTPDRRLRAAAQGQACDNAARGSYSHTGSDGSDLSVRVKRAGFPLRLAVENTARGFDSPERLVAYWMGSPGHRANILNPRTRGFGLGLAAPPGDRPHWVLVMGRAL
ncbi:CAP domain-containing protein, partial [Rhodovulum iodosum]